MKTFLIAAMLAMFAATASAETPAKPLASNESLSKQFASRECEHLSKYRIAATALDAQPTGHDLKAPCVDQCAERRGEAYTRGQRTLILGIAY